MTVTEVIYGSLVWFNAENTAFDCTISVDGEDMPFTATGSDPEERGRAIFAAGVAGDYGPIAPYVPPTAEQEAASLHEYSASKAYEARHETWLFTPTQPGSQSGEVTCMANGKFAVDISLIEETAISKPNKIYKGVDAGTPPKSFSLKGNDIYVTGDEDLATPITIYGQILKRRESISTVEADVADGINAATIVTTAGVDAAYNI